MKAPAKLPGNPGGSKLAAEAAKRERLETYMRRIGEARTDRSRYGARINAIFALAQPDRMMVGSSWLTPASVDAQDEIYDEVLQSAVEDFASDMVDLFTPKYRHWTELKPKKNLTVGEQRAIEEPLAKYSEHLFSTIKESNFYAQLADMWVDIAASCSAICIPFPKAGQNRIVTHHIPLAQLLFDDGPEGVDGRWWEQMVRVRHLRAMLPGVDWGPILKKHSGAFNQDRYINVIQGAVRDWNEVGDEVWNWHVIAEGELVHEETFRGEGSCPIVVTRWRRSSPSAWGPGPASAALTAARTLNKLADEMLTYVEKLVNAPHSYEEDMVQNFENGVDAGSFVPRMPGSKPPEPLFRPGGEAQIAYFEQEDLRQRVRRALFQDKPFQRGDTPPTLGQWFDEKTTNNRRMENPRDRIVTEGVLPWLQRFAWIEKQRGNLPEIKLQGDLVEIEIQSPLSKASDMEDVSVATQILQLGAAYLGEEMALSIDGAATLNNVKGKLNDRLVAVLSPEQIQQRLALRQGLGGAEQAVGEG